jgi:hypothetical protein
VTPDAVVVGTGLADTTTAGRLYDERQWRNAFGISPLWVTWETVARSPGARAPSPTPTRATPASARRRSMASGSKLTPDSCNRWAVLG